MASMRSSVSDAAAVSAATTTAATTTAAKTPAATTPAITAAATAIFVLIAGEGQHRFPPKKWNHLDLYNTFLLRLQSHMFRNFCFVFFLVLQLMVTYNNKNKGDMRFI